MFVERSGSAGARFIVPATPTPITSPDGSTFACWMAARSVQASLASAHRPSDASASGVSARLLTVKLDAEAVGAKMETRAGE